jgi:hypothetical protein
MTDRNPALFFEKSLEKVLCFSIFQLFIFDIFGLKFPINVEKDAQIVICTWK